MILRKNIMEFERRSTRSCSLENSLWKRLWACRNKKKAMCLATNWMNYFKFLLE
jgi:hypothetical protein